MSTSIHSTTYTVTPIWYTSANTDVIAYADGPHADDINISCFPKTGSIVIQIKDENDTWVTPSEAAYTILESGLVRLPRANMPDMRILATGDAVFAISGEL